MMTFPNNHNSSNGSHNHNHKPPTDENYQFYTRFKECLEQNRDLLDKFNGLLDDKYDLMLEISAFQKGQVFNRNENGIREEDHDVVIPEYDPEAKWIINFSTGARENIVLLKRNKEIEEEIQELKEERNKLAAQVEYRSTLSGGKKMKRVPHDFPTDHPGLNDKELFRRIVESGKTEPRRDLEEPRNRDIYGDHSEGQDPGSLFKRKNE